MFRTGLSQGILHALLVLTFCMPVFAESNTANTSSTTSISTNTKSTSKPKNLASKIRINALRDEFTFVQEQLELAKTDAVIANNKALFAKKSLNKVSNVSDTNADKSFTEKEIKKATLQLHLADRAAKTINTRINRLEKRFTEIYQELRAEVENLVLNRNEKLLNSETNSDAIATKTPEQQRDEYAALAAEAKQRIAARKNLEAELARLTLEWNQSGQLDVALAEKIQAVKRHLTPLTNTYSPLLQTVNKTMLDDTYSFTQR